MFKHRGFAEIRNKRKKNRRQRLEQFQEEVEEEYPKHTDPKKQQPGKNVITPIIEYAKLYDSYLRDRKNPKVMGYKRYEYIHNNFEYLTGIRIHDLYNEDMAGLIENRKTARRAEIDSIIEEVGPHAFAQFILDRGCVCWPRVYMYPCLLICHPRLSRLDDEHRPQWKPLG